MGKKHLKAKFLEGFKNSRGAISSTCIAMGMDRTTYYIWLKNDADFAAAVDALKQSFVEFVEQKVWQKIESGSDYWVKEWLRTHSPDWVPKEQNELSGKVELVLNRHIMGDQTPTTPLETKPEAKAA